MMCQDHYVLEINEIIHLGVTTVNITINLT